MLIIEINGMPHNLEFQSHRDECWMEGYIAVPSELESRVIACKGYCDIVIKDGVMVGMTERPDLEPEPVPDEPTQLDIIEAQVTYTAMMTDTLLGG